MNGFIEAEKTATNVQAEHFDNKLLRAHNLHKERYLFLQRCVIKN